MTRVEKDYDKAVAVAQGYADNSRTPFAVYREEITTVNYVVVAVADPGPPDAPGIVYEPVALVTSRFVVPVPRSRGTRNGL